jgi:hypothetical protein
MSEQLAHRYLARIGEYNEVLRQLQCNEVPVPTLTIVPDGPEVQLLERRREYLVDGALAGATAVLAAFGLTEYKAHEVLSVYDSRGRAVNRGCS